MLPLVVALLALARAADEGSPVPAGLVPAPGYDVAAPRTIRALERPAFAWTPDGRAVLAADPEGGALLAPTGDVAVRLACGAGPARDGALSRDGSVAALVGPDGRACAWAAQRGAELAPVPGRGWVALALGDAATLALARGSVVEVRESQQGGRRWRRDPGVGALRALRVDATGRYVVAAGERGAAVLDAVTGRLVRAVFAGATAAAVLGAEDLWVAREDGRVERWSRTTWRLRDTLQASEGPLRDVDQSADGTLLLTLGPEVRVWDVARGAPLLDVPVRHGAGDAAARARFAPMGARILVSDADGTRLWRWPDRDPRPMGAVEREPMLHRPLLRSVPDTLLPQPIPASELPESRAATLLQRVPGAARLTDVGAVPGGVAGGGSPPPQEEAGPIAVDGGRWLQVRPVEPSAARADGQMRLTAFDGERPLADASLPAALAEPRDLALAGARVAMVSGEGAIHTGGMSSLTRLPGADGATAVALHPTRADRVAVGGVDGSVRVFTRREAGRGVQVAAEPIADLAFAPDGARLLTAAGRPGSEGGVATVLSDAKTADEAATSTSVTLRWAPERAQLATDLLLAVSASGAEVHGADGGLRLEVSAPLADARLTGGELRTLDVAGAVRALTIPAGPVPWLPLPGAATLSPDGRQAAVVDGDVVELWDALRARRRLALPSAGVAVARVAFDRAGERLAVLRADGVVDVWSVRDAALTASVDALSSGDRTPWVRFSEDGAWLWTLSGPRTLQAIVADTGEPAARVDLPERAPAQVETSGGATQTFAGVRLDDTGVPGRLQRVWIDGHAFVVDTAPGAADQRRVWEEPPGERILAIDATGGQLALMRGDGVVRVRADGLRAVGKPLRVAGATPGRAAAYSPDGAHLAVAWTGGVIRVYDARRDELVATIEGDAAPPGPPPVDGPPRPPGEFVRLAFVEAAAGDGLLAVEAEGARRLFSWRSGYEAGVTPLPPGAVRVAEGLTDLALVPDGSMAFTAHVDGGIRAWNVRTGTQVGLLDLHVGPVRALALDADGSGLASASEDGAVRLWDARGLRPLITLPTFAGAVVDVALGPDRVAALGADGVVRAWRRLDGKPLGRWRIADGGAPPDEVVALLAGASVPAPAPIDDTLLALAARLGRIVEAVRTPDGTAVLVATADGRLRVWDVATRAPLATLTPLTDGAWVLDRGDGARVASPSLRDGSATPLRSD
jgi:WD40 repeat protein